MTLTEFLLARIAEDEAAAIEAAREWTQPIPAQTGVLILGHIAQTPARVLVEGEAKRRIVTLHQEDFYRCATCSEETGWVTDEDGGEGYDTGRSAASWPCETLGALTAIYADHPDCRQEWKP